MKPNIKKCPNCDSKSFGGLGGGGGTTSAVLVSATKEPNGKYTPDLNRVLGVTPVVCNECNYVMLFMNK